VSSSLIRQDLVPMVAGYVLVMGTLGIGLRLARRSARAEAAGAAAVTDPDRPADDPNAPLVAAPVPAPAAALVPVPAAQETGRMTGRERLRAIVRPGPGWRRLVIHCLGMAVGGYLLLMVVIIGYFYGIAPVAGNFVQSAFSGCALLIGLATPVFIALSWLVERKGWRI
jgi:hypothetical protein